MADGLLFTEDATADNVTDKTLVKTCESGDECATVDTRIGAGANPLHFPYSNGGLLQELQCPTNLLHSASSSPFKLDIIAVPSAPVRAAHDDIMQPCSPSNEEDCRKKRCVDRYDSSESSDSGVAVLSCTDCSGSSTASSDITDPGSPYSTASNHSDQDSNNSNPTPTQPPSAPATAIPAPATTNKMPPTQQIHQSSAHHPPWHWAEDSSPPLKRPPNALLTSTPLTTKSNSNKMLQQGKITEYFKSHHKLVDNIKRDKKLLTRAAPPPGKVAIEKLAKPRKTPTLTTPRKILPAPSKLTNFAATQQQFPMTLTTLTFQQQQQQMFIPQFANQYVHQGISNFIKINVPIVKLNAIGLDAGSPTVLSATARTTAAGMIHQIKNGGHVGLLNGGCLGAAQQQSAATGLSLSASPLPHNNAFTSTIANTNKRKCSTSNCMAETISTATAVAPLLSATTTSLFTPALVARNSNNNVVTTTTTASIRQPSINVTAVSDTSSKTTSTLSTLANTSSSLSSFSLTPAIANDSKEISSTKPNIISRTPIISSYNNNNTSPVVLLENQTSILNKIVKAPPPELALINPTAKTPAIIPQLSNIRTSRARPKQIGPENTSARSSPVESEDSGISSVSPLTCLTLPPKCSLTDIPPSSQKSPILSQPKTIRFPAAAGTVLCSSQQQLKGHLLKKRKSSAVGVNGGALLGEKVVCSPEKRPLVGDGTTTVECMWKECHAHFEASGALLEHLQVKHVISQASCEHYVCLWQGCKVHGRTSCSRSWLERHVLAHAGTKPFRCIVDGCGMRFNSQLTLQRHVNGHFNGEQNQNGTSKKSVENALKLYKRNGKKIRFRRQPWSARMFDFIDASIMEGLQYQLVKMTEKRTLGQFESNVGTTVTLQLQVLGRRVQTDGVRQLLVRYHPKDILPDDWIREMDFSNTKTVTITTLDSPAKSSLQVSLFSTTDTQSSSSSSLRQSKKHRRKPILLKPT